MHTRCAMRPVKHVVGKSIVPRTASADKARVLRAGVDPDFLTLYVGEACRGLVGSHFHSCAAHLYVPPLKEQLAIMDSLQSIATIVDLDGAVGTLIKMMINHDDEGVSALVSALMEHEATTAKIRAIMRAVAEQTEGVYDVDTV